MECSICYEKFINREEFIKKSQDIKNKHDDINIFHNEFMKLLNLCKTPHICFTLNCESIICHTCLIKIKESNENDIFICPYCRKVDWKDYMLNVFDELRFHLLTKYEIIDDLHIFKN